MRIMIDGIIVECCIGNITAQQDIAALVNPAGPGLAPGPGVSGAIHSKAGPDLYQECIAHAPLTPGKAIITSGHRLPNRYVIHCLPPTGRTALSVKQLEQCYSRALLIAEEHGLHSVAFPAFASGSLGNPPINAAAVAIRAVRHTVPILRSVKLVRFVLFDRQAFTHYRNLLAASPESILQSVSISTG